MECFGQNFNQWQVEFFSNRANPVLFLTLGNMAFLQCVVMAFVCTSGWHYMVFLLSATAI